MVALTPGPVTNDAFLKEKLNRFVDFLKSSLKNRLHNSRYSEFSNKIEQLRTVDSAQFIVHITTDMVPWKSNVAGYVEKLLTDQEVNTNDLTAEEKIKLGRYVSCFIDIVQQ